MCATEQPAVTADDVWGDDDSDSPEQTALDREWEARHQQFYNTGYRQGLDEGKELTLQHGFNAGFVEGARAGFEYGLLKGALQSLTALLNGTQEQSVQVQRLLQELTAAPAKTIMRETCTALLAQAVADDVAPQLADALQQLDLEDGEPAPDVSAAVEDLSAALAATGLDSSSSSTSNSSITVQDGSPPPQQLVAHCRQELMKLGFDVGSAPAVHAAATEADLVQAGEATRV